jgi:hypothetical protein
MRKPTRKEFLKFYADFYGEEVNHLKQIAFESFDGGELYIFCKEWAEHLKENNNV